MVAVCWWWAPGFWQRETRNQVSFLGNDPIGCHFVSCVMQIPGAKFEEHCFNISRGIFYLVFYLFNSKPLWRHQLYKIRKTKTPFCCALKSLLNKEQLFFCAIYTFILKIYYPLCYLQKFVLDQLRCDEKPMLLSFSISQCIQCWFCLLCIYLTTLKLSC